MNRVYQQLKNIYHYCQAHFWRIYYGWPDKKLTLYGVTGTNGKTTTAIVLGSILRAAKGDDKVGLITTEIFWFGREEKTNVSHMTSVDARVVYSYLRRMADGGVTDVVLEMTSHALDQCRLAGLKLAGAMLLNIRHEHLDYHRTMEEYAAAKVKIVNYVKKKGVVVYNKDEEWVVRGLRQNPNGKIQMANQIQNPNGKDELRFLAFTVEQARDVETFLSGDFNKENVLAASLMAREAGISTEIIKQGVAEVKNIPGRVEWLVPSDFSTSPPLASPRRGGETPRVLIDFALTPYAYERLFKYLRKETPGKLIAVFGAAGRRDKEKRPIISKIAAKYADEIVLTQDEPYDDSEEEIYAHLEEGLNSACKKPINTGMNNGIASSSFDKLGTSRNDVSERGNCSYVWSRIEDRQEAIEYAIKKSGAGDVVAITGMGNFDVRMVGDKKIPWKDKDVVESIFKKQVDNGK